MPRNIELKARVPDLDSIANRALAIAARDAGLLIQTDTYFACTRGRLKLREIVEGATRRAELISYHRSDSPVARPSDYTVVPVPDPQLLKTALSQTLDVLVVVKKSRRLLLWKNVRIHLDTVDQLGTFIEFEAVVSEVDNDVVCSERLKYLSSELGIAPSDLMTGSYSDLLGSTAASVFSSRT